MDVDLNGRTGSPAELTQRQTGGRQGAGNHIRSNTVMILSRWRKAISQRCIFSTEDEQTFVFPFGPFAAYLLPDAGSQALVVRTILWLAIASIPAGIATISVFRTFSPVEITLFLIALHYMVYVSLICFITRNSVRLPISLSLRVYASLHELVRLHDYAYRFTFLAILFSLPILMTESISVFWFLMPIWSSGLAVTYWHMVLLRLREGTDTESDRDMST